MSRILFVSPAYAPFVGGAQVYLQALAQRLAADGHQVTVITTTATQVAGFWDPRLPHLPAGPDTLEGVTIHRCAVQYLPGAPWSFYLMRRIAPIVSALPWGAHALLNWMAPWMPRVPHLAAVLAQQSPPPDLVHGLNIALEWPLIAAGRYAQQRGIPFITTPLTHVGDRAVQRNYTMRHQLDALAQSQTIIALTSLERDVLIQLGLPASRIVCIGAGVEADQCAGNAARFRTEQAIQGPLIAFIGTLTFDKGVIHLCQAMRHLWAQGAPGTLVLAGQSVSPGGFEPYYHSLPAADRARMRVLGPITEQTKHDLLAAMDVFVMPSRIDSFGIVYLEAWLYGKPVIGARAGGVPALIADGATGLLVEFGNVPEIAAAIRRLVEDPTLAAALGAHGQALVRDQYTWQSIYRQVWAVYQAALGHSQMPFAQMEE